MKFSNMENCWGVIGCGWLGLPFAQHLIQNGNEVIGTTTSTEKMEVLRDAGISPVLFSTDSKNRLEEVLNSCNYLLLNIPPSSLKENYADAMLHITDRLHSKAKIIFISSTSVYADKNQEAKETDDLDGEGRNAPHIIEAEKALKQTLKDRLTIIRMAGLVGGDRHPAKYMSGNSYDNGKDKINLIHLEDCIGLINKVVEQKYFGEILNGCSTEHPMKMDYYTWAAKKINIIPPVFKDKVGKWKEISNKKSSTSLKYNYKYDSPYDFPI
jgi:nucleoside-diphosphate-sugar epimerase